MQVIIAGGGPAGSIAAEKLASSGIRTILFERAPSGDKTCAGGIPSALVSDFNLPDEVIHQKCEKVRFFGPSGYEVDLNFPEGGYLATVRRHEFDMYLRQRAKERGALIEEKEITNFEESSDVVKVEYKDTNNQKYWAKADYLIGADGAVSRIARLMQNDRLVYVASMQEFIRPNPDGLAHWNGIAELYYSSKVSPDYYGWIFPHKGYVSIGVGTHYDNAKNISQYLDHLKSINSRWLDGGETLGRGSAPIPSTIYPEPAKKRVFLVGDAAGFVLPGCGEGIYYAMKSGLFAAEAILANKQEQHSNPALIYNLRCEREFKKSFAYFKRVEKIAFKDDFNRELFVRYCRVPGAADNFLNVFSLKKKRRSSSIGSKIQKLIELNKIKSEIKRENLKF
jgi:geranylgeranyl reductase